MASVDSAVDELVAMVKRRLGEAVPRRALVAGVAGGLVTLKELGATTAGTEGFARAADLDVGVDDEVIVIPVGGKPFVAHKVAGRADARGRFNVRDYGARGDGSTNDTAAIQAAIDACEAAGGGVVFFPVGDYRVTGLTIFDGSVCLVGEGPLGARIAMTSASGDTLVIGSTSVKVFFTQIVNLLFRPTVTRDSGVAEIRAVWFYDLTIDHCRIEDAAWGVKVGNTDAAKGSEVVRVQDSLVDEFDVAFYLVNTLAPFFRDNRTNAQRLAASTLIIEGGVEGGSFVGGDHVNSASPDSSKTGTALIIRSSDYTTTEPRWLKFVAVHFDQHRQGLDASSGTDIDFDGCWFSNRPWSGASVGSGTKRFRFRGCDFSNCGNNGILLDGGNQHRIVDCAAIGNDQNNTGNHGIYVSSGATNVRVSGCVSRNDPTLFGAGFQDYGIFVAGGSTNYTLVENDTQGNATGGISEPGGAGAIVANNR